MKRGELITARFSRDIGKPRPALIVQADRFEVLGSILLCPLTSDLTDDQPIRVTIRPSPTNGLQTTSRIMVDKIFAVSRDRCGATIGTAESEVVAMVDQRLLVMLGLAD